MTGQMINYNGKDIPMGIFHRLQCYYALKLEAKTGLRHSRGSVLKLVQQQYGVAARTKTGAMKELAAQLAELGHEVKA